MFRIFCITVTAIGATLLSTSFSAHAASLYRITDLGVLPAVGGNSDAHGINNVGQVVGTSYSINEDQYRAFVWAAGEGMQQLGGNAFFGRDINNAGHVVGSTGDRAFLWTSGGGTQELGVLPGFRRSRAYGINDAGQVVGTSDNPTEGDAIGRRAFLWTAGGGMQNLGDLPGGWDYSDAHSINNAGQVVGVSNAATGYRAFLWSPGDGMQDLGDLPGGENFSSAHDINGAGEVVGESGATLGNRAFLWTAGGGMQDLGVLPGFNGSLAFGVNDAGQVVGRSDGPTGPHAFLWTASVGMQDLNALIDPLDPLKAVTVIAYAQDINSAGQIAATAIMNPLGDEFILHAFLLTPVPEPASWVLVLVGLVFTGLMRRRRTR